MHLKNGLSVFGGLTLIVIILAVIYGGVASPTEAAAVSAIYAYLIAVFGYRDMWPLERIRIRQNRKGIPNGRTT